MENFKFKLKFAPKIIAVFIISTGFLKGSELTISNYIDNYTKSICTLPAAVQIQLTNYLLVVNALEPLTENSKIDSSLDKLILSSDSEPVCHHAKLVKLVLSLDHTEIFSFKDQTLKPNDSEKKFNQSILIFLEYINQNMFNNK